MAIAGVASSVDEALRQAEQLRPDVVLVDSDVRGESGLELVGGCTGWAVTARFR